MPPATQPSIARITVGEYLERERASTERHNYLDGIVFPVYGPLPGMVGMAGESLSHGRVSGNVFAAIHAQLRGKPCEVFTKDTKVRSGPAGPWNPRATAGMYSYPDVVIVCGTPVVPDDRSDVVLNPKVVLEVLTDSTESFDRGEKFERYARWNPTLTDYLLARQNRPHVEHFTRQPDGSWRYVSVAELDTAVEIPSINVVLRLADIYDRVEFAEPTDTRIPGGPDETPNS
ncbi:MAG: Uma2 family endonuclease [Fimbriiglobus sp.]